MYYLPMKLFVLGPRLPAQSYLNADKIIAFAKELGVDGIHPGYGFLSENAEFAKKVEEAGIIFIGPGPEAMRIMGSKLAAKECVKKYNIPMVPGIDKAIEDINVAKKIAAEIGYPILSKHRQVVAVKECGLWKKKPTWKNKCKGPSAKQDLLLEMVLYLLKNMSAPHGI